ncbi:MAG: hypothetical protein ACHQ6T_03640 [Myxococcota bacterium]
MKQMRLWGLVLLVAWVSPARAANIVTNPGFESGLAAPWFYIFWGLDSDAHSGTLAATTSCSGPCNLFQDLTTVSGQKYDLSFWFKSDGGPTGGGGDLTVSWDGAAVLSLTNIVGGYTQYTVPGLVAGASPDQLGFAAGSNGATLHLDDVVVDGHAIPEPSTMLLLLGGTSLVIAAAQLASGVTASKRIRG